MVPSIVAAVKDTNVRTVFDFLDCRLRDDYQFITAKQMHPIKKQYLHDENKNTGCYGAMVVNSYECEDDLKEVF